MQLDNLLSPIKSQTELVVHFAKIKPTKESVLQRSKVGPEDFKFLKIIGRGSYSYVTVARKKDSGRLYAIKIMKKAKLFKEVGKSTFISESEINKKFQGTPFVSDTYYAFQTEEEMFLVMEL
jgi:serine/threonine protein kinase